MSDVVPSPYAEGTQGNGGGKRINATQVPGGEIFGGQAEIAAEKQEREKESVVDCQEQPEVAATGSVCKVAVVFECQRV
ncbi:hypothetical protein GCM10008957_54130 [Deinococcus ruber]|uniref:Uncharacterized protein n=1 Tax=Deinococcus ruber TaxID=1848197 RepID=A0A918FHH2_9DEIO|nr:hypothetical protein [Deinococcus ruber]GGR38027.1 hypothetical protein GCM10008957_54130 [Deinococcus ruber]